MAQAKMPPRRTWLWFVLIVLANYVLVRLLMPDPGAPVTVPYTLFHEEVGKGLVQLAPRENPYLGGSNGYAGARPFSEATRRPLPPSMPRCSRSSARATTRPRVS
jgi:cell division protease FtsH